MNRMVSVIVAIYNVADYLPRCIESITQQTYHELEIVLVDDGSTDSSGVICDKYAVKDSRISVIHKENGGAYSARNAGLKSSRGQYILMIDGDDYMLPTMVSTMIDSLIQTDASICVCGAFENRPNDNVIHASSPQVLIQEEFMPEVLMDHITSQPWNKLIQRECFDNLEFLKSTVEDMAIMHKVFSQAQRVVVIPDQLYVYVTSRTGSITNQHKMRPESSLDRARATEDRYIIAHNQYPACADVVLYHMVRFYVSAYIKMVAVSGYNCEMIEVEDELKQYWPHIVKNHFISFSMRTLIKIIIRKHKSLLIPVSILMRIIKS